MIHQISSTKTLLSFTLKITSSIKPFDDVPFPNTLYILVNFGCYNFGDESKNPLRGQKKNTKNVNNIVYINIFLTIIMSDKVCTRFPSPCHTVTQTVHVTLLHGHGHGHR